MVTTQPVALAYSENSFHDPHGWHPERWLPDAATNPKSPYYNDRRKATRPFGVGPYNCVGEPLAWAQMRLLVAKMIWAFDFTPAATGNSKIEWEKQKMYGVVFKQPLDVTLAERTT